MVGCSRWDLGRTPRAGLVTEVPRYLSSTMGRPTNQSTSVDINEEPTEVVTPKAPEPTPPVEAVKKPEGLGIFRALLEAPLPSEKSVTMRPVQAALLALFALDWPRPTGRCDDAGGSAGLGRTVPHDQPLAWHAALTGNFIQFAQWAGKNPAEVLSKYQKGTTEIMSYAFSHRDIESAVA